MDGRTDGHSWLLEQACLQPAIKNTVRWIHTLDLIHRADSLSCVVILWQLKWKLSLKIQKSTHLFFCSFTIWDGFGLHGLHDLNAVFGLQLWTSSIKQTQKIDSPFGHKMTTYIDISVSSIASNTE